MAKKQSKPQRQLISIDTIKQKSIMAISWWWIQLLVLAGISFFIFAGSVAAEVTKQANVVEIYPSELVLIFVMHLCTAIFISTAVYLVLRKRSIAAKTIAVILVSLLLINYDERLIAASGIYKALIPILPQGSAEYVFISIFFLATLAGLVYLLGLGVTWLQQRYSNLYSSNVVIGCLIVVVVMNFGQVLELLRIERKIQHQAGVQPVSLPEPTSKARPTDKPDIYYIVLDRNTNNSVLQEQLQFNNQQFTDYLTSNNFTVQPKAASNYPFTTMSLASTLNADYTNRLLDPYKNDVYQSRILFHQLVKKSSVVAALKKNGYTFHNIGAWYAATQQSPQADVDYSWDNRLTIFNRVKRLTTIQAVQFSRSPYYRFFAHGTAAGWPIKFEHMDRVTQFKEQMNTLQTLANASQQGGRFIFSHITIPHEPFFFNSDGSLATNSEPNNEGKLVADKYLGQVQFINDQMRQLTEVILQKSANKAVILLNADEGPYPHVINSPTTGSAQASGSPEGADVGNMTKWPDNWLHMKFGIQQVVHIPKANQADMQQLSSVNLFRIVLNRYLNYQLPYLPDCHFGYQDAVKAYQFSDVTAKLTVDGTSACSVKP